MREKCGKMLHFDQYIFLIAVDISGEFGGNVVCIFGETWLTQNTDVPPKCTMRVVANGTSKNVGLAKFWQDLEISKAFLVSLKSRFCMVSFLLF